MVRRLVAVAFVATALAGCLSGKSSSPSSPSDSASPVGPTWTLASIEGRPPVSGTTITAEFSSDSRVAGKSGCNNYTGHAEADGGRLSVGLLASTMMACQSDGVMEQEARYLTVLQAATSYAIAGDELRLGPASSATTLVFTSR